MDRQDLNTLIDFHYWARDRVLDAAEALGPEQYTRDLGSSFKSVRDTLVHFYSAEWAWYQRWHGTSPTAMLPFEDYPDVRTLREAWMDHERKMRAFVAALDEHGMNRVIEFKTLAGQPFASPIWQMVQHIVNHGSYHRGQVQTMLRQLGAKPSKSVDLIAYYREKQALR
jgi:uncharacterized damage-inducible protein DinB